MSRDAGFTRADVDTGLFADPKVVRLARHVRDPQRVAAATCLYVGLVLASWKAGERVTLEESAPAWFLEPVDELQTVLLAADLVDTDGRIPVHAWSSWYEPARERRQLTIDRWARSNAKRRAPRDDDAATALSPRGDEGDRSVQDRSLPTGQVLPLRSHRAAIAARGGESTPARGVAAAHDPIEVDRV